MCRDFSVIATLFLKASSLQRKRAVLTVAAIAWGTVAILMLLAFGEGLRNQMVRARHGMGENIAVWWSGETSRVWQGLPEGRPIRARLDDLDYLRAKMPSATGVVGEMTSWQTTLTWGTTTITGRVTGSNWQYGEIRHHFPQSGGRFFNANDERDKKRVIFLGNQLVVSRLGRERQRVPAHLHPLHVGDHLTAERPHQPVVPEAGGEHRPPAHNQLA